MSEARTPLPEYFYRSRALLPDGSRKLCDVIASSRKEAREKVEGIYPGCTVRGLREAGAVFGSIPTR